MGTDNKACAVPFLSDFVPYSLYKRFWRQYVNIYIPRSFVYRGQGLLLGHFPDFFIKPESEDALWVGFN